MCDHYPREAAMVTLARDEQGTATVWCDPCIAPIINALNEAGLATAASCCGHNGHGSDGEQTDAPGWVMLRDGRTFLITASPSTHTQRDTETAAQATMPLHALLRDYRDGDGRGWQTEFDWLESHHGDRLDKLTTSVQESGIREPILLGDDGRVWDGRHRLAVAQRLGLDYVPVRRADSLATGEDTP
jgi:hypothetical protein